MSSRTLNRVTLIGNVGSDPTLKYLQNGTPLALFRMATNRTYSPSNSDESVEDTEWHQIVIFGKLAEIAEKIVKKGSKVFVEGRLKTTEFQNEDGGTVEKTEIVANELILLDSGKGGNGDFDDHGGDSDIPTTDEYIPEYNPSY